MLSNSHWLLNPTGSFFFFASHVSLSLQTLTHAIRPVNQPSTSFPSPAIRKQPAGYHFSVIELFVSYSDWPTFTPFISKLNHSSPRMHAFIRPSKDVSMCMVGGRNKKKKGEIWMHTREKERIPKFGFENGRAVNSAVVKKRLFRHLFLLSIWKVWGKRNLKNTGRQEKRESLWLVKCQEKSGKVWIVELPFDLLWACTSRCISHRWKSLHVCFTFQEAFSSLFHPTPPQGLPHCANTPHTKLCRYHSLIKKKKYSLCHV